MTKERFTDLFSDVAPKMSTKHLHPGERVDGVVVGIGGETIFLDIGGKSEGCLAADELRDENGELTVKEGDRLQVYFLHRNRGEMVFTTRLGSHSGQGRELETAYQSGIPVEGRVTREVKGGFEVMIGTTRAFCPYSQMDIRRIEKSEEYLEKSFSFRIIEYKNNGRNIVVSARVLLEEEREEKRRELEETLQEGMLVRGRISSVRDFGAFVDLGGIDGLIPISEIAWGNVEKVSDLLEVGMEVEVIVKSLDWERNRISLSLKATTENPWEKVEEKYPVGSVHMGRVARLTQFGAFVTLEPGIDGLLHISKLGGGRRINHPREVLESGKEIAVRIDAVDREKQRISLVPDDYREKEKKEVEDGAELSRMARAAAGSGSLGTFGDLFKAQLAKKERKKERKGK